MLPIGLCRRLIYVQCTILIYCIEIVNDYYIKQLKLCLINLTLSSKRCLQCLAEDPRLVSIKCCYFSVLKSQNF